MPTRCGKTSKGIFSWIDGIRLTPVHGGIHTDTGLFYKLIPVYLREGTGQITSQKSFALSVGIESKGVTRNRSWISDYTYGIYIKSDLSIMIIIAVVCIADGFSSKHCVEYNDSNHDQVYDATQNNRRNEKFLSHVRLLHGLLDVTTLLCLTTLIGLPDAKGCYTPGIGDKSLFQMPPIPDSCCALWMSACCLA